jgi:hypothetical protein
MIGGGKMNYGEQEPGSDSFERSQEFPGHVPSPKYGPPFQTPGGSIRNNLGSGLKQSGFFQKDGHINNLRGGFIGQKYAQPFIPDHSNFQAGMPTPGGQAVPHSYGNPNPPRQLILQAAQEGFAGNGIATIAPDNSFFLVANLPLPQTFLNQGTAAYASYLVDNKGQTGFLAGILRPIGNGVYQTQFRSSVPLSHYNKVVVSVENPQYLGQAPNGPIILKVKEPMGAAAFLKPVKNVGGSIWEKVSGLFRGKSKVPVPPVLPESTVPEVFQASEQMGAVVNPAPPMMPPDG